MDICAFISHRVAGCDHACPLFVRAATSGQVFLSALIVVMTRCRPLVRRPFQYDQGQTRILQKAATPVEQATSLLPV